MIESRADGEAFAATVVLWFAVAWIILDNDRSTKRSNGRGVKVQWAGVVLPGGHGRGKVGFSEEVKRELGLRKELVPQ